MRGARRGLPEGADRERVAFAMAAHARGQARLVDGYARAGQLRFWRWRIYFNPNSLHGGMAFELSVGSGIVSAIVTILVATLFIYFAARFVLDRSSFVAALLTAVVATFLATLVAALLQSVVAADWVPIVVGIAVWALVAAIFFRAKWIQGAIIGLVAWLLWALVVWLIGMLFG